MSGNVVRFKMDRVLKLKETESIAVPAMSDYLSVGNNTAENANSNTYVYQPNKSLHQVSESVNSVKLSHTWHPPGEFGEFLIVVLVGCSNGLHSRNSLTELTDRLT